MAAPAKAAKPTPPAVIKRLGWDWRDDGMGLGLGPGVCLTVCVQGRCLRAFVPLSRVMLAFDEHLSSVGYVGGMYGQPYSVGGFFSSIAHAVSSVAKKVVPKAVQNAASSVVKTAEHYGAQALHAVNSIPVLGTISKATTALALLPAAAAAQLVQGKRIDQIALGQFKTALGSAKALAPYVQTVISFVPGVGQGISAGIGGALALAQGQSITEAMIAAAQSALPGGPLARAAFAVASDAMQGRPITTIALDALPGITPQAKQALVQGISAAKALADGKPVAQTVIDNAIHLLPAAAQKAVQVGVALGHAKNLQSAAGAAVQGAAQIVSAAAQGAVAAQHYAAGNRSPAVMQALELARQHTAALATIVQHAQAGHPQANQLVNALKMIRAPAAAAPPRLASFLPRLA